MDGDFEIEVDDQTAPDYDISANVAENLVDVIRSDMVGNEAQFLAINATYASGLSLYPNEYIQTIVRGKSGEGKTELKQNADSIWPTHWLLRTGSTSDMGLVDSDAWDSVYVGAFAEFQQMQGKMLEMVKSSAGDDADENGVGFSHTRNVDGNGDDDSRDADEIEKQAMPTVFLFADENNAEIPKELETRQMVVRVESDEEINKGVAKTKFDHTEVEVTGRDHEYNFNFEDGKDAVRNHIANIPKPLEAQWSKDPKNYSYPVVIPHDESVEWPVHHPEYDSYGWDAFEVVKDILNYKKTESKRGAQAIANHIRAHARLNYHTRDTMEINGVTHIVADPQDVGNVLSYRDLLLSATHDMNEQKLAVIEALTDEENGVGAPGPNGGLQAPHKDIRGYIDEYADITSLSKSQLTNSRDQGVLDQMEEDYLIEVHEGEGENGAHLYEFLGGSTFGHPNLDVYDDLFSEVTDPIRGHSIRTTVEDFKESLSVKTSEELMADDFGSVMGDSDDESSAVQSASDDDSGTLSDFGDGDDTVDVEWDGVDHAVHERLQDTLDDKRVTPEDIASLDTQHMLNITPVEMYTDDRGLPYVRADRPRHEGDKEGTIMDPSHSLWGDKSEQQVESIVENTIAKLRKHEVFEVIEDEPDSDNDDSYLLVDDLE